MDPILNQTINDRFDDFIVNPYSVGHILYF